MRSSEKRKLDRRNREDARRKEKKSLLLSSFDEVSDPDNLYLSFKKSRRGVTWKESVQRYEMNLLRNIFDSVKRLRAGDNTAKGFVEFDLFERGRLRHIKSVHISERVVQKCLCDKVLVPMTTRSLIYDNGASLKNKGLHFAIKRLICHLSKYYRKNGFSNEGYCLEIDFSKYFDNVLHEILYKKQAEIIKDQRILKVINDFISPFGDGMSLGLGSQVSQISAIFYPSKEVDHFIKEVLRIKYYGRYMDDLYLIHNSKEYLKSCLEKIREQCETIGIKINMKKTRIIALKHGVKFLKGIYMLSESGKVIRRACPDSRKRMRRKLTKFKKKYDDGKMTSNDVRTAYQSWRGNYLKRFNAYHTVRRMDSYYNRLFA